MSIIRMTIFVVELGHSDLLLVYESNFAEIPISLLLKIAKYIHYWLVKVHCSGLYEEKQKKG